MHHLYHFFQDQEWLSLTWWISFLRKWKWMKFRQREFSFKRKTMYIHICYPNFTHSLRQYDESFYAPPRCVRQFFINHLPSENRAKVLFVSQRFIHRIHSKSLLYDFCWPSFVCFHFNFSVVQVTKIFIWKPTGTVWNSKASFFFVVSFISKFRFHSLLNKTIKQTTLQKKN
jgi:hypothetical protein